MMVYPRSVRAEIGHIHDAVSQPRKPWRLDRRDSATGNRAAGARYGNPSSEIPLR
jgi:hypothetical protein